MTTDFLFIGFVVLFIYVCLTITTYQSPTRRVDEDTGNWVHVKGGCSVKSSTRWLTSVVLVIPFIPGILN